MELLRSYLAWRAERVMERPGWCSQRGPHFPWEDQIRRLLRGRTLACWCKPGQPCHADLLTEIGNSPAPADASPLPLISSTDRSSPMSAYAHPTGRTGGPALTARARRAA